MLKISSEKTASKANNNFREPVRIPDDVLNLHDSITDKLQSHEKSYCNRQAVEADGTVYVSGQLPIDPISGTMPDTVARQTEQSLLNIGAILAEAGCSFDNVVKSTVLLDDISNFGAMNEVYARFFTGQLPARVCYQVAALPNGATVEIDVIAVK